MKGNESIVRDRPTDLCVAQELEEQMFVAR